MRKHWMLLAFLVITMGVISVGCTDSSATTGVVNGYVYFATTENIHAIGVAINVSGPNSYATTSNSSGVYSLTGVSPGTYVVTANFATATNKPEFFTIMGGEINDTYTEPVGETLTAYNVTVAAGSTSSVDFTITGTIVD